MCFACLIRRQSGKLRWQILLGESMYLADVEISLAVTEELIDGKNLLIRKFRTGVVAEFLVVKTQRRLIDITYIYKPISFNFFS